ncbi:hypothetical protein ACFX10_021057 [Malus domestica]
MLPLYFSSFPDGLRSSFEREGGLMIWGEQLELEVVVAFFLTHAGKECWCRLQFQLVQTRSIWCRVAVSARAGKERLVLPFMLVQTRSVGVAFYARADQERCAMQFRLVQVMSLVSYSLGSCGQEALVRAV